MGPPHTLSYAEYLALERSTDTRHEYLAGEVWAMAGGTLRHSAIKANLLIEVASALRGTPCRVYDSDAKVRVEGTDLSTYPDLAVVCGPVERSSTDRHALTNPTALFEVLSPSTERWDRGGKFRHVRTLGALRQYVLVNTDLPRVEVFTRGEDGAWSFREYGPGEAFPLHDGRVAVDALWADLPDEEPEGA